LGQIPFWRWCSWLRLRQCIGSLRWGSSYWLLHTAFHSHKWTHEGYNVFCLEHV
jgi:hypothetical protein